MRIQTANPEADYQIITEECRGTSLSDFRFNILPVEFPTDPAVVYFKPEGSENDHRFSVNNLPGFISGHFKTDTNDPDRLYMCFQPGNGAVSFTLNIKQYPAVARAYYTYRIRNYFASATGVIIQSNFLHDSCFWFPHPNLSTKEYRSYRKFLVRLQYNKTDSQPELLIAYSGIAKVLQANFSTLNGSREIYESLTGNVVFRNEVYPYSQLPESARYHPEEIYPVLNRSLSEILNIRLPNKVVKNKHEIMVTETGSFMQTYLNNARFKEILNHYGRFKSVAAEDQMKITHNSNRLVFGENNCSTDTIQGIKSYGPCRFPDAKQIVFFYIYDPKDKEPVSNIHKYLSNDSQESNRLNQFISMPCYLDSSLNIKFDPQKDAPGIIMEKVSGFSLEPEKLYYAFYVSQLDSRERDPGKWRLYYEIKEILLTRGIALQVLDRNKLLHGNIRYFIPNIAIAMIGKLGGIPWRLDKPLRNELIVGFGAFRSKKYNMRYVGASCCFTNDGLFQKFDFFRANDTISLAGSVEEAVIGYSKTHSGLSRIVIHFYKELNNRENRQLEKVLRNLNLHVPVFIVSVNKTRSQDTIAFLNDNAVSMPVSGSIFRYRHTSYLLYINDRKSYDQKCLNSMPAPLKIKLSSGNMELLEDRNVVIDLMQQVYDFCFMYWRSCRHSNLPVTMAYPEMIAGMVPWFNNNQIPEAAKGSLWFL